MLHIEIRTKKKKTQMKSRIFFLQWNKARNIPEVIKPDLCQALEQEGFYGRAYLF